MSQVPPVICGDFAFANGVFYTIVDGQQYPRGNLSCFNSIIAAGGSDDPDAFWVAQLIHYGLQVPNDFSKALTPIFIAVAETGELVVPQHILDVEASLKKNGTTKKRKMDDDELSVDSRDWISKLDVKKVKNAVIAAPNPQSEDKNLYEKREDEDEEDDEEEDEEEDDDNFDDPDCYYANLGFDKLDIVWSFHEDRLPFLPDAWGIGLINGNYDIRERQTPSSPAPDTSVTESVPASSDQLMLAFDDDRVWGKIKLGHIGGVFLTEVRSLRGAPAGDGDGYIQFNGNGSVVGTLKYGENETIIFTAQRHVNQGTHTDISVGTFRRVWGDLGRAWSPNYLANGIGL
ncbi:hypothetical protein F5Y16DRAFT_405374 [Xylariaceae sp. FL0255]|nr:hypothetical protein F5Y16DRAFT_405374 [Xylariaceae sp. FL0255]